MIFLHKLTLEISKNEKTSFIIALLFIFNPVFWYYRDIANTYVFESLAILSTAFFAYESIVGEKNRFALSVGIIAILMGFRPSIILAAAPILFIHWIFSKDKIKNIFLGAAAFLIIFSAWFIPFAKTVGWHNLSALIKGQLTSAHESFSQKSQLMFLIKSLIFSVSASLLVAFFFIKKNLNFLKEKKLFYFLISPAFLIFFYALVHFGEVGYLLGIISLFSLLIIYPVSKLLNKSWGLILLIAVLIGQICCFIYPQKYFQNEKIEKINYVSIRARDTLLNNYISFIKTLDPKESLILILRGQYFNAENKVDKYENEDIRALGYYLPEYKLYDFSGVTSEYSILENFDTAKYFSNDIEINSGIKNFYVLANYVNPIDYTDEFTLSEQNMPDSALNYYLGNIENIDEFEFKGFFFTK